jgi:WD40 repeat protein
MSAEATAKADPKLTHMAKEWKYDRALTACRFDPTGKYVFSGAQDNTVQRWQLMDGKLTKLAAHDSWVRAMAFSPDGKALYTGGYDGRLIAWPATAEQPEPSRVVEAHDGWIRAVAVSPTGERIATCGNDLHVRLWNAADGKLVYEWPGHESHVYNVAFHPSGEQLVSCDLKGNFKHWDAASGKLAREFAVDSLTGYDKTFWAHIGGARSMAFSSDGNLLAAGGITKVTNAFAGVGHAAVVVIDWQAGKLKIQHEAKAPVNGVAWGAVWHPDGYWIGQSGGGGGGLLYFWKPDSAQEFHLLKLTDAGHDLALHPDGLQLAVPHADGNLRIYRMTAKAKA